MHKIFIEEISEKSQQQDMKDDIIIRQSFTCCGRQLERFLWEGWDCVEDDTIKQDVIKTFKFCPFCGEKVFINTEE